VRRIFAVLLALCAMCVAEEPKRQNGPFSDTAFLTAHGAMIGGVLFDYVRSAQWDNGSTCVETNSLFAGPHGVFERRRYLGVNLGISGTITVVDRFLFKHNRGAALVAPVAFGTTHFVSGARSSCR